MGTICPICWLYYSYKSRLFLALEIGILYIYISMKDIIYNCTVIANLLFFRAICTLYNIHNNII